MPEFAQKELFQQAKSGNGGAFAELQDSLSPAVARFIRRLIGRSPSEEDFVRDAFYALYSNLGRIESVEALRPFLFRVVRNLCYTELRRRGRFRIIALDDPVAAGSAGIEGIADARLSPDERVGWMSLWSEIQGAMDRLPETQRQALILYCLEDLSYAQVADAMDTDLGTVKSRIHYARKSIARMLGPETMQAFALQEHER